MLFSNISLNIITTKIHTQKSYYLFLPHQLKIHPLACPGENELLKGVQPQDS